jgi:diguanylate cyclase (GGDEF)-like protein/PAS domain S-box-containing protein
VDIVFKYSEETGVVLAHSFLSGDLLTRTSNDQQHQLLRADLLHEALGPSLLLDLQGELIASNKASLLLWDCGPAQAAVVQLVRNVAANGTPAALDIRTETHPIRRFHMRALLISGDEKLVWCSGTEMSVQDHLIDALKESRALFRDLVDAAGDFCAEVDLNGCICYVSGTGALGYDAWQLNGQHISRLGPETQCLVSRCAIGPIDIKATDIDGQERFLSVVGAPVVRDKIWTGTRLIARDVTNDRATAQAMRTVHVEQLKNLERLSRTDELTGLANRRAFEDEVQRRVASLERHDGAGSLMLLDLDHFKTLNDTLGHAAGDSALQALSRTLQDLKRETDLVARIGGDEFAIWLDGCSALGAQRVASNIVSAMADIRQMFGGGLVELSASIGIAEWHRGVTDMQLLLRRADDALYEVKRAGRDAYHVWVEA